MNSEKLNATFASCEALADELRKVHSLSNNNETINKILCDFKVIEKNCDTLQSETAKAIKRMKNTSQILNMTAIAIIFVASTIGGAAAGYTGGLKLSKKYIQYKTNKINKEHAKMNAQYAFVNQLKSDGFKIYSDGIVIPSKYRILDTKDGRKVLVR